MRIDPSKSLLIASVVGLGVASSGGSSALAAACSIAPVSTYTATGFSCSVGPVTFSDINVTPSMTGSGAVSVGTFSPFMTVIDGETENGLDLSYTSSTSFGGGTADVAWTYDVTAASGKQLVDASASLTGGVIGASAASVLNETLSNGKTLSLSMGGRTSVTFAPIDMLHATKDQQDTAAAGSVAFSSIMGNGFSVSTPGGPPPPPGVIPEPSTWAMLLLGFAGIGFFGYRQAQRPRLEEL
jgi:hypothetical protein